VPSLLKTLQPAFTTLGKAIGSSFKTIGQELTSPAWASFFKLLAGSASKVVPLLTGSFIQFARILRNIATASMPFLIQGLKALNGWLKGLAGGTSNAKSLQKGIGGLVDHLKAWVTLGAQVGKVFFDVLATAAPIGLEIVKWLSQGAQQLANWVSSSKGQERIKQFFTDVLPLIKEMVTFFGQLAIVGAEVFQALAPSLAFLFQGLNLLLKPVIFLLDLFNKIPASVRSWLIPFGVIIGTVTTLIGVAKTIAPLFGGIGAAIAHAVTAPVAGAWNWIVGAAKAVFGVVKGVFKAEVAAVVAYMNVAFAVWGWIFSAAKNVAGKVSGVVTGLAHTVGSIASRAVGSAWHWLADAAHDAAGAVKGVISALVGWVKARVNDAISVIRSIISAINSVRAKASAAAASLVGAIKAPVNALIDGINAIALHLSIHKGLPGPLPDINIDTTIDPFPTIPHLARGVRNFMGGFAWVGENGPELAAFPPGTDVFTSGDSRRMASGMGQGGGDTIYNIEAPAGELPDPGATVALIDMKMRARGKR
jgi:phage-related protein